MFDFPVRDILFRVDEVVHYTSSLFLLSLSPSEDRDLPLPSVMAGQFVEVQVPSSAAVFLRRPISVYRSDSTHIELLIQAVGRGTRALSECQRGDRLQVLMPLGHGFGDPSGDRPLLIGGGVGVAPLLMMGEQLRALGTSPTFLLGARSADQFGDLSHFEDCGELLTTTEDGSRGEKGYVIDHSALLEGRFSDVYTCGPTPMMKAVVRWAKQCQLPCQVSLENIMGCGIGVCLCCVEPTVSGHRPICTEGPVFDMSDLLWE